MYFNRPYVADMETYEIAIIGAGFAGASTAWHLTAQGVKSLVILEQEELPGMHSSGLNAGMIRQFEEDKIIGKCSNEGADFLKKTPKHWEIMFDQIGSLILFNDSRLNRVKEAVNYLGDQKFLIINKRMSQERIPLLIDAEFDHAVWTASDGVVDINKLLWFYIKDAKSKGAELKLNERAANIKSGSGKFLLDTGKNSYEVNTVINATGAWVQEVGKAAGAFDIKFSPLRRHLYTTEAMENVDSKWPFVWDIDNSYYFRPESGGLLLGPCDEEKSIPGMQNTSHKIKEMLAEKLINFCPRLSDINISKEWAGLRTFSNDRRFVIGEDPKLKNFFWAAGLGGWGVTSSYAVGKLVADAILNNGKNVPRELKPDRYK